MLALRRLFRRGIDASPGLPATQAGRLSEAVGVANGLTVEPKPFDPVPPRRSQDELIGVVDRLDMHLEAHSERADALMATLQRLPPALEAVPELDRRTARLLEAMADHHGRSRSRQESMDSTLTRIAESGDRQTELIDLVRQQLVDGEQSADRIRHVLEEVQRTLAILHDAVRRTGDHTGRAIEDARRREASLEATLLRVSKWVIALVVVSGITSAAGIVAAVAALIGS